VQCQTIAHRKPKICNWVKMLGGGHHPVPANVSLLFKESCFEKTRLRRAHGRRRHQPTTQRDVNIMAGVGDYVGGEWGPSITERARFVARNSFPLVDTQLIG